MPNGWWFDWESLAMRERAGLETRCVESLLVVYLYVSLLCLVDAKDRSFARKGLMTNWPHHNTKKNSCMVIPLADS